MVFRPLEVARLLARWARRRSTALMVANFKLPMRRKAEIVREITGILADGGYRAYVEQYSESAVLPRFLDIVRGAALRAERPRVAERLSPAEQASRR